jgi:hypothetical protein
MQFDFSQRNRIYNNLFYANERTLTNNSFRWHVTDNIFQNNIFFANGQTVFLGFPDYRTKNRNFFTRNVMLQKRPGEKVIRLDRGDDYTLAAAQENLADLYHGNIEVDPMLLVKDGQPVDLKDGSPCIDAGRRLTQTTAEGKGTLLVVKDALWFSDGNGQVPGDEIMVGAAGPARITKVDYEKNTLTLDKPIAWKASDPVNLAYKGKGTDIGPFDR